MLLIEQAVLCDRVQFVINALCVRHRFSLVSFLQRFVILVRYFVGSSRTCSEGAEEERNEGAAGASLHWCGKNDPPAQTQLRYALCVSCITGPESEATLLHVQY